MRNLLIPATALSVRTKNLLLRNGMSTVGQFDGLSEEDLLQGDQIGPTAVKEIVDYLKSIGVVMVMESVQENNAQEIDLPSHLIDVPVSDLAVDRKTVDTLAEHNCRTLGGLFRPNATHALGPARWTQVFGLVDLLRGLPVGKLAEMSWGEQLGRPSVPRLSSELLKEIASATTFDEEVEALCADLSDRDRSLVLARLRYRSDRKPTLDQLGARIGVSRERVRQIVTRRMKVLSNSGLRLPIGSRVVREIDVAGGAISAAALAARFADDAIVTDELSLGPLGELSDIGLVPKIIWAPKARAWVGVEGYGTWIETGQLDEVLHRLKDKARGEFRRIGAVKESTLEELSPLGPGHAATLAIPDGAKLSRVLGYVIPVPPKDSAMIRQARKVLAVTTPLSVDELHSGLLRHPRLDPVPPRDVVEFILEQHLGFEIMLGRARLTAKPRRSAILSRSERALVKLLEENQGVMLFQDMVDGMRKRGFSEAMTTVLTRSPILSRVSTAVYALRGRTISNQLLSARRKSRMDSRSANVVSWEWEGPERFIVTYRVSRFNLSGVFSLPSAFSTQREEWRCRLPTGETVPVTIRDQHLWGIYRWMRIAEVQAGDYLIATFYPAQALVEIDLS